jgi:hypothetical protein
MSSVDMAFSRRGTHALVSNPRLVARGHARTRQQPRVRWSEIPHLVVRDHPPGCRILCSKRPRPHARSSDARGRACPPRNGAPHALSTPWGAVCPHACASDNEVSDDSSDPICLRTASRSRDGSISSNRGVCEVADQPPQCAIIHGERRRHHSVRRATQPRRVCELLVRSDLRNVGGIRLRVAPLRHADADRATAGRVPGSRLHQFRRRMGAVATTHR